MLSTTNEIRKRAQEIQGVEIMGIDQFVYDELEQLREDTKTLKARLEDAEKVIRIGKKNNSPSAVAYFQRWKMIKLEEIRTKRSL